MCKKKKKKKNPNIKNIFIREFFDSFIVQFFWGKTKIWNKTMLLFQKLFTKELFCNWAPIVKETQKKKKKKKKKLSKKTKQNVGDKINK